MFNDEMLDLNLENIPKTQKVFDLLKCLILNDETIERIKIVFKNEMELALNMQPSSLQMENTYIPELPDGTENGVFLALDLGGTNLRVILLTMRNGNAIDEIVQLYDIPDEMRIGCGNILFDFLAECIDTFAVNNELNENIVYPLGFTFSFPMRQNSLNSGILVTWTKTFNCPSIVGVDVVAKLRESLLKYNRTNIEILAILNDTTGTLMHGALLDKQTRIGIVLGTGSNGCYMEYADRVKHWEQQRHGEDHVIIDVEWGAFGDNGVLDFIRTEFDRTLDDGSLLKKSFTFEKYISGKYLGELCRVILEKLYNAGVFLSAVRNENFPKPWSFGSDNVSIIEDDTIKNSYENVISILKTNFQCGKKYSSDDLQIIRFVCGIISLRAAQLLSITTSVLLNRMDDETDITIAIDGSVYKHHPRLRHWVSDLTAQWTPTKNCKFMLAEDGSGKGAALVAAIAEKLRKRDAE